MSSDDKTKVARSSDEPDETTPGERRGPQDPMGVLGQTIRLVFSYYPVHFVIIVACILAAAILTSLPSVFMQQALRIVNEHWQTGDWDAAAQQIMPIVSTLICVYAVAIAAQVIQGQVAAVVTQGTLMKVRNRSEEHTSELQSR